MKKFLLAVLTAAMIVSVSACNGDNNDTKPDNTQTVQSSVADESTDQTVEESSQADTEDSSETVTEESAQDSTQESTDAPAADGSLASIYEMVKSQVQLPEEMIDITAKRLDRVMGITEDEMDEFTGGICADGVKQDQIIYIKAKDESKVEDIKAKLQTNLDSIYNVVQNYDPKQKANIENAKVEVEGLYVSLVISADSEQIRSIFSQNLG